MTTPTQQHTHSHHEHIKARIDPVCGMSTDEKNAFIAHKHEGKTYYFCSEHCQTEFTKDPGRYIDPASSPHSPEPDQPAAETIYTCPMHPEVQQNKPGICPKCGMTLEALTPTVAAS